MDRFLMKCFAWFKEKTFGYAMDHPPQVVAGMFLLIVLAGTILIVADRGNWDVSQNEYNRTQNGYTIKCLKECVECHVITKPLSGMRTQSTVQENAHFAIRLPFLTSE